MNRLRLSHFFGLVILGYSQLLLAQVPVDFEHDEYAQEEAEKNCPRDVAGWNSWRETLRNTKELSVFNRAVEMLRTCPKLPRVAQLLAARADLKACLLPLINYADAIEARPYEGEEWSGQVAGDKLPAWLNGRNIESLRNKSEKEKKAYFDRLAKQHPEARFFTYLSEFPEIHGRRFFGVELKNKKGDRFLINLQLDKANAEVPFQGWVYPADKSKPAMAYRYDSAFMRTDNVTQMTCGSCHVAGFVPIHADPTQDPIAPKPSAKNKKSNWVSTEQVNADYKGSHKTFVSEIIEKLGLPGLGEGDEAERQRIVEACAKDFSAESKGRLVKAMDCATCHAPGQKGLTLPGSDTAAMDIYLHSIRNGNMPPGINDPQSKRYLKPEEQLKLMDCLEAGYSGSMGGLVEFEGALRKHLLRVACPEK